LTLGSGGVTFVIVPAEIRFYIRSWGFYGDAESKFSRARSRL